MGYSHYISELTKFVETVAIIGGYPFLFLTVLFEGIPLLGTLVPGHISIIVAGFLIRIGVFNVWFTCALAVIAAVSGDYIGFYLGKRYGLALIDKVKPFFFITDEHIAKVQRLLDKHTGKAMILGRLSPVTRSLMPFMVGANHSDDRMDKAAKKCDEKRFWIFNIIGGSIWAVGSIILGYVFGAGYQMANIFTGKTILIVIGAGLIIIWGYRFVNVRFHVFKKYELFILLFNILSLWGLLQTTRDTLLASSQLAVFDISINTFISSHVTPQIVSIASKISDGGVFFMLTLGMLCAAFLLRKRKWRSISIFVLSLGSSAIMMTFLKEFFMRTRPENALQFLTDPSFPSGHATMAAAFFLVIMYLLVPKIHSWIKREVFIVVCVLSVIAIGLSRVVLNVHWSSDVIAGWSLGVFCTTASILLVRYIGGIIHRQIIE
ncbi:MAG: bifunctional DedA family/phosphatase PAP2 family protein [Candidatus Taylorbacteria bacterium]